MNPRDGFDPSPTASALRTRDGIGLIELIAVVWRRKLSIGVATLAGALLGLAAASLLPPSWRATALVQIGQVGQTTPAAMNPAAQELVESPARAAERVNDPVFVRQLLSRLGLEPDEAGQGEAAIIVGSLKASTPKGADLLELRVSGSSADQAKATAVAAVALLADAHDRIAEPTVMRLRGQLKAAVDELDAAVRERAKLAEVFGGREVVGAGNRFAESVLLGDLLAKKDGEIREMRDRRLQLEEQLSPSRTFRTALLSDVYVPRRQTFPKRSLFVAAGAVFGLLAGLLRALAVTPVAAGPSLPPGGPA